MKTTTRYLNQHTLAAVFAAGVLAVAAAPADARKGPQASVASSTTCALSDDYTTLIITTSLTDKSSGDEEANVTSGTIQATYKKIGTRGNTSFNFQKDGSDETYLFADDDLGLIGDGKDIVALYDLCDGAVPRYEVENGRALSATSTVNYNSENGPDKSVINRCSADPETGLGSPIRVADVYDLIVGACGAP